MSNWVTLVNGVHIDLDYPNNPLTGSGSFGDNKGQSVKGKGYKMTKEEEKKVSELRLQYSQTTGIFAKGRVLRQINAIENGSQDYMMSHRPTKTGITADDITNQDGETPLPKDFYDKPQNYMEMDTAHKESMAALNSVRGNSDATITIYRATTGNEINDGDWITLSKTYAETHSNHSLGGKANIVKMVVPVKDIQFAGDDINEWGYHPKGKK